MSLKETLERDRIAAMKESRVNETGKIRLNAVRSVLDLIVRAETNGKTRKTVSDDEIINIIRKAVAQRRDTARIFNEANEKDRARIETIEADFFEAYVPSLLTEEETIELVKLKIRELSVNGPVNMGQVMSSFKTRNDVDMKVVSKVARDEL